MNQTDYRRQAWPLLVVLVLVTLASSVVAAGTRRPTNGYRTTGHRIEARIYPDQHRLKVVDQVSLHGVGKRCRAWRFRLDPALEVSSIGAGGKDLSYRKVEEGSSGTPGKDGGDWGERRPVLREVDLKGYGKAGKELFVEVSYGGVIYDSLKVPSFSREFIANQTTGLIGEEGVYLGEESWWYPRKAGDLVPFSLEVIIPSEFEVVSQGELELNEVDGGLRRVRWNSVHPTDVIYLVAGKYDVEERDADGVKIYAYFFPESKDLRDTYLTATERYIRMYSDLIGPYPYKKFAVVENFFETGYGMPSFTLLGRTVIRLPFIVYTSLGHEILHNWWGNSVFIDSSSGNWCESLTAYMADYYYKEQQGATSAKQYRMEIDRSYSNYVNANNDFSLATFTSRTTPATRAVGYGKGAMVYHGLRRILGDRAFFQALRNFFEEHIFTHASWDDLKKAFEKEGKIDLGWYFHQWVEGIGAPLLRLEDVGMREGLPGTVEFVISQEGTGAPYRLEIPVVLETKEGREEHLVGLRSDRKRFSVEVSGSPISLSVDPDFHLFRRMDSLEIPPSLGMVLGDENEMIVLPDKADSTSLKAYMGLLEHINRTGKAEVRTADEVGQKEYEENSIFIFGGPGENSAWSCLIGESTDEVGVQGDSVVIAGKSYPSGGHSFLSVLRSPHDPGRGIAVFFGYDEESVREAGRKLVHYGKYGYLVFEGGKNVAKGSWEVKDSPLTYRFDR